jgi:hypothetical protein
MEVSSFGCLIVLWTVTVILLIDRLTKHITFDALFLSVCVCVTFKVEAKGGRYQDGMSDGSRLLAQYTPWVH